MKPRPDPYLHTTSLWEFPSANYGSQRQGDPDYPGSTPSHVIWNCLVRYTAPKDLVVDPMCGGGTTLDVCRDLGRRAQGFDLQPSRRDILAADARKLPLDDESADFVFVDPPYSTHLTWSGQDACLGEASAFREGFFEGLAQVVAEIHRILKPDRYAAVYIGDSWEPGKGFAPIGHRTFALLLERFTPVDEVCVVRHHQGLRRSQHHETAAAGNYMLRGYHHLYIVAKGAPGDRRDPEEAAGLVAQPDPERAPGQRAPYQPSRNRGQRPKGQPARDHRQRGRHERRR